MSKSTDQWMPLHIGDYHRDTKSLTAEQHGAYLLLLMESWIHGHLPDDEKKLAQICGMTRTKFANNVAPAIMPYFTKTDDGRIYQKRLESEREKAAKNIAQKVNAARARHDKNKGHESNENNALGSAAASSPQALRTAPASVPAGVPSPSPVPSSVPEDSKAKLSLTDSVPAPETKLEEHPRLSDSADVWMKYYPWLKSKDHRKKHDPSTRILDIEVGEGLNRRWLIDVCRNVCREAGFDPNHRDDWTVVMNWIQKGYSVGNRIQPAIREAIKQRQKTDRIRSVRYFINKVENFREVQAA